MGNEWFDIAYINFSKAILHGQIRDEQGDREIEQVLTDYQKRQVEAMNFDHQQDMKRLLKSFVKDTRP